MERFLSFNNGAQFVYQDTNAQYRKSLKQKAIFSFLLDIFFIYISNVIPFPGFSAEPLLPTPPPPSHQPTHSCFLDLHWPIKPSQDQRPLLPLMTNQAILYYICSWSHESHHVSSLVGGLVPGSSGGTGQFILLFLLWGCKPLQLPSLGTLSSI